MLLEANCKLEEQVVAALARHPGATAAQLHSAFCSGHRAYTLQAVYQELRKLQRAGVVAKFGPRYMLRTGWVLELLEFASDSYERLLTHDSGSAQLLPEPGRRLQWRFGDLHRVVSFYTHLGLVLLERSSSRICFEYAPHIWYHLAHSQSESQFLHNLRRTKSQYFVAVGGDSFLDRSYAAHIQGTPGKIVFGQQPLSARYGRSYTIVIDDYVSTLRLGVPLEREVSRLYTEVSEPRRLDIREVQRIVHMRAKIVLKLEHNAAKAARLRRAFEIFWGVRAKR